jgi:hypothetical protein
MAHAFCSIFVHVHRPLLLLLSITMMSLPFMNTPSIMSRTFVLLLCTSLMSAFSHAFTPTVRNTIHISSTQLTVKESDDDVSKFGFGQRIESVKCLALGAVAGSLALAPFSLIGDVFFLNVLAPIQTNGVAQWEFDTDMSALQAGLFAIVYRYCIREDENPQLNQGVIGAFVVTRALSRVVVSSSCSAVVLNCGAPLGYFDWSMIGQVVINGAEATAMFGATAYAVDWAMAKGWLSKFPC